MRSIQKTFRRIVVDGLRVLIADDHADTADNLGLLIKELNHEVCVTYGGLNALKVAADFLPDLILLDLEMPDLNGFELVKLMRQSSIMVHTRIVAVTGQQPTCRAAAQAAGFDQVLFKPVSLDELCAVLSRVVEDNTSPAIAEKD